MRRCMLLRYVAMARCLERCFYKVPLQKHHRQVPRGRTAWVSTMQYTTRSPASEAGERPAQGVLHPYKSIFSEESYRSGKKFLRPSSFQNADRFYKTLRLSLSAFRSGLFTGLRTFRGGAFALRRRASLFRMASLWRPFFSAPLSEPENSAWLCVFSHFRIPAALSRSFPVVCSVVCSVVCLCPVIFFKGTVYFVVKKEEYAFAKGTLLFSGHIYTPNPAGKGAGRFRPGVFGRALLQPMLLSKADPRATDGCNRRLRPTTTRRNRETARPETYGIRMHAGFGYLR